MGTRGSFRFLWTRATGDRQWAIEPSSNQWLGFGSIGGLLHLLWTTIAALYGATGTELLPRKQRMFLFHDDVFATANDSRVKVKKVIVVSSILAKGSSGE
ncbi:hypothetical protein Peur_046508 [Populus x canadensis]